MSAWGPCHDQCVDCGTVEKSHMGHGLCTTCYKRRRRAGTMPERRLAPWSAAAPACIRCGRTSVPHHARGLCRSCNQADYAQTAVGRQIAAAAQLKYRSTDHGQAKRREANVRWSTKAENKEKVRLSSRRTRERKYGLEVELPVGYEDLVFDIFGRACASCGATDDLVLDHHRPLRSGHPLLHNAVPLCRSCNCRKRNNAPEAFYKPDRLEVIEGRLVQLRAEFHERFGAAT